MRKLWHWQNNISTINTYRVCVNVNLLYAQNLKPKAKNQYERGCGKYFIWEIIGRV